MKPKIIIGLILIALGIFSLLGKTISYKTQEKVLDVGPIQATATKKRTIPLIPILGFVSLVGGVSLVVIGAKNKKI